MHGIIDDVLKSAIQPPLRLTPVESIIIEQISFSEMLDKMRQLRIPPVQIDCTILISQIILKE